MSTPGQDMVASLSGQLGEHMVWDESELVTLGMIEAAVDRLAVLRTRCATALADVMTPAYQAASLAGEVRRCELHIYTLVKSLDPNDEQAKSARHVAAANSRWHRTNG